MTGASLAAQASALSQRAAEVALCLDFDGTLAPVVDDPTQARPLPEVRPLLADLADRYAAVALISGRPAAFLAANAHARGVRYLGLYGLQEVRDGEVRVDPRLTAARSAVEAATGDLRDHPAVLASGAYLEDKEYAIAVHTRRVDDPQRWSVSIDEAVQAIAGRRGLEVISGKLVWELRPAVRGDKGDAVRRVVAESAAQTVVVIGDDLGDLPAFAAARAFIDAGHDAYRIAVRSAEVPAQLLGEADYIVDGPAGVLGFLQLLAGNHVHDDGERSPQRSTR